MTSRRRRRSSSSETASSGIELARRAAEAPVFDPRRTRDGRRIFRDSSLGAAVASAASGTGSAPLLRSHEVDLLRNSGDVYVRLFRLEDADDLAELQRVLTAIERGEAELRHFREYFVEKTRTLTLHLQWAVRYRTLPPGWTDSGPS